MSGNLTKKHAALRVATKNSMPCTVYCACSAANGCCNLYTIRDDAHKDGDEQAEYESEEQFV